MFVLFIKLLIYPHLSECTNRIPGERAIFCQVFLKVNFCTQALTPRTMLHELRSDNMEIRFTVRDTERIMT